jgi:hypothetical protein
MKISHLDGLSPGATLLFELAAWADKATGSNATKARARAKLTNLETRENMRLSSARKLKYEWKKSVCGQTPQPALADSANPAEIRTL